MICPYCQSENVKIETFQENTGSNTVSATTSRYREKGHGVVWWLFIGWWWWFVDLLLWFYLFIPRLILKLCASGWKRKKYVGTSGTVSTTQNSVGYRTVCTCQSCGRRLETS